MIDPCGTYIRTQPANKRGHAFLDTHPSHRQTVHATQLTPNHTRPKYIQAHGLFHVSWNSANLGYMSCNSWNSLFYWNVCYHWIFACNSLSNFRTKSKHPLRFHRAAYVCLEGFSFVHDHRVEAGRLANIDLDHGRDIVGPTIEATLLCHAGFVLTGRRSTSQGLKTSLQDLCIWKKKPKVVVGVLNPQFLGSKKRSEWIVQDFHVSSNLHSLHCQWWRFHCGSSGSPCKKHA